LSFTLPAPGRARLAILDAQGRKVATPLDDMLPAGQGSRTRQGWDDRGRAVGRGMFYARLEGGGRTYVRPFAFVR
jgi:hypothetical protein